MFYYWNYVIRVIFVHFSILHACFVFCTLFLSAFFIFGMRFCGKVALFASVF